jgi:hypothetical protein
MPEYKIMEWNETNCDLTIPFVEMAYHNKKWAFVSDFIRLEKLFTYGGVYLDTDMLLLKSLDEFLGNECFFGAEDSNYINAALFGAIPNSEFIKSCKAEYDLLQFEKVTNLVAITIPQIITKKFRTTFSYDGNFDDVIDKEGVKIYPPLFFYPFPVENKKDLNNYDKYIVEDSYAVHLWSASWIEYSEFQYFRNSEYSKGFQKVFEEISNNKKIDLKYIRKLVSAIKESFNTK